MWRPPRLLWMPIRTILCVLIAYDYRPTRSHSTKRLGISPAPFECFTPLNRGTNIFLSVGADLLS